MIKFLVTFFAVLGFVGTADAQLRKPGGGGSYTGGSTYVAYGTSSSATAGESAFTYTAGTNTLVVDYIETKDDDGDNAVTLYDNGTYDCSTNAPDAGEVQLLAEGGTLKSCENGGVETAVGKRRGVRAETSATTYDIGATAARTALEAYNGYYHICNRAGTCTWTLPAAVASATETMYMCFGTLVSQTLTVGAAAGDTIIGSGETCVTGSTISVNNTNPTSAACLIAVDANTWFFDESKGNWACD